jgi:hypothetical protein
MRAHLDQIKMNHDFFMSKQTVPLSFQDPMHLPFFLLKDTFSAKRWVNKMTLTLTKTKD